MVVQYKSGYLLFLLSGIISVARGSICETNRDSRTLIQGVDSNVVNKFLQLLHQTNTFNFQGDNINHANGCRREMQRFVHKKGHFDKATDKTWILDCWEPVECVLVDGELHGMYTIEVVPSTRLNTLFGTNAKAVLLPLDERNSISYTFLPFVQQRSSLFVTALLSGCSVFVATAGNENCNIIVMHANRFCSRNEPKDDDDNHKQAMFVLEQVNLLNEQCNYQIQRRWSSDHKRNNIKRHDYHYPVVYYRVNAGYNFIYGYNLGGLHSRWHFCVKELHPSPQPERCNQIS
ncbi:uncharacterized protein LOC132732024 [Ruditapes philippinarum]|uniref:uncharacterized protein LOC132732024 n=1 Tax=Ruditapes philippinarum TaxID=129788 RepID=UPI00295AE206|nr:uncharacterized protein LOC132732024 [Ruditapes philippinarum]